jgi:hypothetical protein
MIKVTLADGQVFYTETVQIEQVPDANRPLRPGDRVRIVQDEPDKFAGLASAPKDRAGELATLEQIDLEDPTTYTYRVRLDSMPKHDNYWVHKVERV